ncbi:hypothetical protein [Pseudomonas sp. Irchel s3f10]|uniref:hypothetical protein n=1 Tax=Pseudomonas sp. Irchel s3f10 TaxID=2009137 RepID=UPI0021159580|nr:hypothetical protein [Pseudomonas sp. Irchel s3f10]
MSQDKNLEGVSENADISVPQEQEPLLSNGVSPDGQYVGPLQIQLWEIIETVDTNSSIIFNIPQSDGEHQVWIDYHGPNGYFRNCLVGKWYPGVQWNEYRATDLPEGNGYYATQWNYKGNWSERRDKRVFVRKLPVITGKDEFAATVYGTGVTSGRLEIVENLTGQSFSPQITGTLNNWSIKLSDGLKPRSYSVKVRHSELGYATRFSTPIVFNYYGVPAITRPKKDDVITQGRPLVEGEGYPDATVRIYQADSGVVLYGEAKVSVNGYWSTTLLQDLPAGRFTFTAQQSYGGSNLPGWAKGVDVFVTTAPVITPPDPGSYQNQVFTVTGSKGALGGTVQVLLDGKEIKVGESLILTGANWSASVEVPAGNTSLVAINVVDGRRSEPSGPRAFKVRPAKFVGVNVEVLADGSIKFSGSAHAGATVVITAPGYAVTPPGEVVATGGQWATTATDWPYGTYNLQIVQKVRDGASGWIESQPFPFQINKVLADVSEVTSTPDYQPTVTGKGSHGATVQLLRPGGSDAGFPDAVVTNGQWSSTALTQWGPTRNYPLNIRQSRDGQHSPNWVAHYINIPPLAPGLDDPLEDGLSPRFSGTCWPGAVVSLQFSDEVGVEHEPTVSNDKWTFRRSDPFATGVEHTVTVTQFAAEQTSLPASATFTVRRPMSQPRITYPDPTSKVGRDVTVEGDDGMQGAVMQLRDAQFQSLLGPKKTLDADGAWSIDLAGLEFRRYTIDAQQILDERPSERSEHCYFDVVLLPPQITQPTENGKLPRTAKIAGSGMANGRVEVFLEGVSEPLLSNILVNDKGDWEGEVTLPVGRTTIRARQTFVDGNGQRQESDLGEARQYDVVPAAPLIETPTEDDPVGRRTVVSGFGVPGDTVTVTLADATHSLQSSAIVQEDRTWSVTQDFSSLAGGPYVLEAVASLEEFASVEALRPIMLGTFLPTLDAPAAGRWVSHPLQFAGRGRKGVGTVVSWYNPDVQWTGPLPIAGDTWHGEATQPLPESGNWYRFRQSLTDEKGDETISDWVVSARFEVERAHPSVEGS